METLDFCVSEILCPSGSSHLNCKTAVAISTLIVLAGSSCLPGPGVDDGSKQKPQHLSCPGKRRFSDNQFCTTTRVRSHSETERSTEKEQPLTSGDTTSASVYKLNSRLFSAADSESSDTDTTFSSDDTDYGDSDGSEPGCSSDESSESDLCGFG